MVSGEVSIQVQSVFQGDAPELRGVRLDVEVRETLEAEESCADCCIYDIEPQNEQIKALPKRSRFYQAKLDSKNLEAGEKNWDKLPDLYVIMITNYDPFGEGYMMYTVHNKFKELPDKEYEDGLTFVYFNTKGKIGGNKEIRALLNYLQRSIMDNVTDETTKLVHNCVEHVKQSAEIRGKYMTIGEILNAERTAGHAAGEISGSVKALRSMGVTDDEILRKLTELYQLSEEESQKILKEI